MYNFRNKLISLKIYNLNKLEWGWLVTLYNFAPGPGCLPKSVLLRAQQELLDYRGLGISVMELGHRTAEFAQLMERIKTKASLLFKVPANYRILLLAGGAQSQFSFIPLNLTKNNQQADYFVTGAWSKIAAGYASRYASVNVVNQEIIGGIAAQDTWQLNPNAAYAYYCPNETINGIQFPSVPKVDNNVPLVADMTSYLAEVPVNITDFGLIFASAQKNLGIAGITLLIIREDLLEYATDTTPEIFNYKLQNENNSVLNTIPVFPVYMLELMLDWINESGGVDELAEINLRKANKLYTCIDNSDGFYFNSVKREYRSSINVPFNLADNELLVKFLDGASARGLKYLKGHKSVGGIRASLYNALPEQGVDELVTFMSDFMLESRRS